MQDGMHFPAHLIRLIVLTWHDDFHVVAPFARHHFGHFTATAMAIAIAMAIAVAIAIFQQFHFHIFHSPSLFFLFSCTLFRCPKFMRALLDFS